ncbi:MAG: autotransporter-associated N-terminal domain-containing protein [Fusobacterium varium]|uniref:autotransporter-associated N-terminal domain-containing protein n=1 Tax=Fusobacterium varium TaxID=856 RepID=UPI002430DF6B|nr:autotransporter-associated N-terminal domain-containing protein [Fusobacterium varium]UYI78735.1 MAG: autotransporter-associated N-terminal domain-containing protein [Fusobacterium varium]
MKKGDIEKSLKRFLKRKVSYSLSLLIAFMITGGISLGAGITAEEIQETKGDLLTKIQTEREEIKRKIAENERMIKEYNSDFVELVRKGDFYSKPLFNSTQVFLSYQYLDNGKMKDRTDKEFSETIDAINKHYGTKSGRSLLRATGNIGKDKIMSGNGVAVDTEVFREEIEVGANIVPIEPILPEINKTINVAVGIPTIGGIPSLTTPTVTPPTAPATISSPTISVTTPGAVASINVTAPTVPTPTVPGDKTIIKPTVVIPHAVDPTMVSAPEKPTAPDIIIPELPTVDFRSVSLGNGDRIYIDAVASSSGSAENAIISNVAVMDGTFKIKREVAGSGNANNAFKYSYSGYKVLPYISTTVTGVNKDKDGTTINSGTTIWEMADTTGDKSFWSTYANGTGVQKLVSNFGTFTNGNFIVARESENVATNLGEFLHVDVHGSKNISDITTRLNTIANYLPSEKTKILDAWTDSTTYANYTTGMYWLNNGKITLEGGNLSLTNEYSHTSTNTSIFILNTGEIELRPYISQSNIKYDAYNSIFLVSNDTTGVAQHIWHNTGKITTYTNDTAIFTINSTTGTRAIHTVVVNKGQIEMNGNKSVGVYARSAKSNAGTLTMDFEDNSGNRVPLVLNGDSSIGIYIPKKNTTLGTEFAPTGNNIKGNFHVNIGGNGNKALNVAATDTNGGKEIVNDYGDNQNYSTVDGTVGILSYNSMNLTSHGIIIYDKTENCIGVVPLTDTVTPTITLGNGSVEILGGKNNIGIVALDVYDSSNVLIDKGGNVSTTGSLILDGGKNNVGAVAKNGYSISIKDIKGNGNTSVNGIGLYAEGSGTSITATTGISNLKLSVDSPTSSDSINALGAFAASGAVITANKSSLNSTPDIEIQGAEVSGSAGSYRGIGLMVNNGIIHAQYTNIKVTDGAAGIASIGTGGNIDFSNGKIEVNNGYAAYTDGVGKINLTDAEIVLNGTATAFDIDKDPFALVTLTLTGTKVHVKSNDVIVFNIKNMPTTSISTLQGDVTSGVTVTSDAGITEYLEAALEKTTINVDVPMDKSSTSGADFYYFNRVVAQNSVLNVNNPVTANLASASTGSALGAAAYKGQIIGLEMNSSKNATSNATTKINNNSIISAARTDAGAGAVGVFINYGQLNNAGTIEVQKGYTSVKGGTGIFATNGSNVDNNSGAKIDVYGDEALGIYATAWRKTSLGTLAGEEFGSTALNQGKTSVTNNGDIITNGENSVGIYLENNSRDASLAPGMDRTISATNTGTITVGKNSIGIYASGTGTGHEAETEIGNTNNLKIGENSTGIYGENAVTVTDIGNLELGKGATGIALSPDSVISSTATIGTITSAGAAGDRGVIAIHGDANTAPVATTIQVPTGTIDTSNISNVTSLYVQGVTGASTASTTIMNLGANGVGIYVNNGSSSNDGKIEMTSGKTNAVGMYTKKGTVINNGTIEVGDSSQLGMVAVTNAGIAINHGTIDLKSSGAAGMVGKDGAEITDSNTGTIKFNTTNAFGIAADNATVNLGTGTMTLDNSKENIYVYAKNGSIINVTGNLNVDGVADAGTKKSVGIYLDGTNTLTSNAIIKAENAAVGIYVNGVNTLTNGTYTSEGDKTVGIYFSNGGTLANATVNSGSSTGNSVGIYGAAGNINLSGGLTLNIGTLGGATYGTGMYLADGAGVTGGTITLTNNSSNANIGLFYTGGNTKTANHDADIILTGTNQEAGIYANAGIQVTNSKNITDNTAPGSVGALISGGSTYTANGNFTRTTSGTAVGYYVDNGTADNKGTINLTGAGSGTVGMVAEGAAAATATAKNSSTITTDNAIGIAVLSGTGTSTGINTGTINVTTGTGVYAAGTNAGFNGAGGTINLTGTGTGIALNGTGAGKITNAGTLNLSTNSVGVYGNNNAKIDFPVTINGTSGTGVYVENGSVVSGAINAGNSKDTVAVYLKDNTASVNGAVITTGGVASTSSVGLYLGGSALNHTVGNSTINAPTSGTVGILTENGNTINYSATTNVGNGAIGMYLRGAGTTLNANAGTININGTGIGVLVNTGATANLGTSGNLTVNFTGDGGILSFNDGGTVNLGANIAIGSGTGTLAATKDGNLSNSGTITIGNGSAGLLGVYSTGGPYIVSNTATGVINVQEKGLGLVATGTGATVTVKNDNIINVNGKDAVGMYTDVGNIDNTLGTITVTNSGIGMYLSGSGSILNFGTLNVTKGVGYVVNGATLGAATGTVTLHAGDKDNYSIGGYYLSTSGTINLPTITDADYSIKTAIYGGTNTVTGAITAKNGQNKIGVFASNSDTTLGTVAAGGKGNIGVYGKDSELSISGITVDDSTLTNTEDLSVGVVLNGGSYNGSGNVTVGNNGIGVYATGIQGGKDIVHNVGTLQVGNSSLGFYGEGTGAGVKNLNVNTTGINIGTSNAVGVYAKNMNTSVSGNMTIGEGSSVGIASIGDGNIGYTGSITVTDKGTQAASVGIYKKLGSGTITTSPGNWTVGDGGYGIYVQQAIVTKDAAGEAISTMTSKSVTINNSADMNLGMSSVGIFSNGDNTVNNSGNITVGKTYVEGGPSNHSDPTKHLNSVGIYGAGGTKIFNAAGATIKVHEDHSVGVYVDGSNAINGNETRFENHGIIDVDNGGVGVIVRNGAIAVNEGVITLGGNASPICGAVNVGMSASGPGSTIENNGTITVNSGAGMLITNGAIFENHGTIVVNNGVGIEGVGSTVNAGHIVVNGGVAVGAGGLATANVGSVTVKPDGTILINDKYTSIGGTLSTTGDIIVDGAYVDATTGTPLFDAHSVSGEVRLRPNFATTGNGISYEMEGFVKTAMGTITGTKLTPVTSPLFIAKVTDKGSLVIAKRPYADLVIGEQFDPLYKGLDNILKNSGGTGRDADILKGLNEYLEGLPADQFERETSLKLAETRGDIYATIQGRMQDINQAFANSFYELESSYNLTKDSSKYSVIYTDGNYKDSTLGIDDYDYKVMGLLYMKEKEGTEYGSKYGYTIGFAGSKFDFDDGGSKEDVYSLRVGAHRVKNLSDEHKVSWLSRIELGYNRHIAKRKLNLQETFENKGEYNTYSVAFDNKLTKVIYTDLSRQLDVYADLDLEYGKVDDFKEHAGSKGGLEVQIKDNDYLSAQAAAGVKASQRIYAGNDISVKVTADVKYAYEFGDNYDGNKARLKNGEEGYYSLITPEEREGKLSGKIGLTVEKANHMGVTFEVEAADESHKKDSSIKYGVRFNYKF